MIDFLEYVSTKYGESQITITFFTWNNFKVPIYDYSGAFVSSKNIGFQRHADISISLAASLTKITGLCAVTAPENQAAAIIQSGQSMFDCFMSYSTDFKGTTQFTVPRTTIPYELKGPSYCETISTITTIATQPSTQKTCKISDFQKYQKAFGSFQSQCLANTDTNLNNFFSLCQSASSSVDQSIFTM